MKTNNEILNEIHTTLNHQPATMKKYRIATKNYCNYQQKTLHELLKEAEQEEEKGIRWKNRKLKKRMINYQNYLIKKEYSKQTINTYIRQIKSIYYFHDIEIHRLPQLNYDDNAKPIRFEDLPDKEIIREVLKIADTRITAIILFLTSTGVDRNQITKITIHDYIEATKEYHNGGTITEIIQTLKNKKDIVPCFHLKRSKTSKYFTTFASPEAVTAINKYLETRDDLQLTDKLFQINYTYLSTKLGNLNDKLNLGRVRYYRRLRCHMFRKYHASMLYNDGMSMELVNDLQGKSKNTTDQSYFFVNDGDLKIEYIKHLSALQIYDEVNRINIKSKEFMELESENNDLKKDINSLKEDMARIKKLFDEA